MVRNYVVRKEARELKLTFLLIFWSVEMEEARSRALTPDFVPSAAIVFIGRNGGSPIKGIDTALDEVH